ncbi:MAG: response regulator [Candidatus Eisenbacteria sp.]|nr:response regulator [Candidatus Eisenbacteria bacterium]
MEDHRVLIVDDDSSVARVLARAFERAGYVVATAPDGEWALTLLADQQIDIMICDIQMPRMDGRELCRHLTRQGPYLPACTLIVTSRSEHDERAWVEEFPGVCLVEKPVGPKQLLRRVRRHLESLPGFDGRESGEQRRAA